MGSHGGLIKLRDKRRFFFVLFCYFVIIVVVISYFLKVCPFC